MTSLIETCENHFVDQILSLPPLLRERLLKVSEKAFKRKIRKDVVNQVEKKIYKKISTNLPDIIQSEIIHNLRQNRTPYHIDLPEYSNEDTFIVELGKQVADAVTPNLHHELRIREMDVQEYTYNNLEVDSNSDSENVSTDYDYPDEEE